MRETSRDPAGLVERLRAGEPRAFEELVRAYQHRVFGIAVRMLGSRAEAEEIAQEVFVRVHRSVARFRGDAALSTWLYAITSRVCLDRLGAAERKVAREGDDALLALRDDQPDPPATLERKELERALHQAIAGLPDERRLVVVLRDLEGLSYDEIAAALDIEVGTVKSRLHRARMELKDRLEKWLP
ncbi:MAG: sigma-70 family RNA polymerase sigma factor [Candidatus Rokubacteria bacterium]|nr:sigma-70 family RNA polymerase sigma factor [Candidatus Rokubacteria bacterium]